MRQSRSNSSQMPWQYARTLYHRTPWYQHRTQRRKAQKADRRRRKESELITMVFDGDLTVRTGPFRGLQYIDTASGINLVPKILGSYEQPIHTWVSGLHGRYRKIINIGCAEGYYAVGFAFNGSADLIRGYDIDAAVICHANHLAERNELQGQLIFGSMCDHAELAREVDSDTLVFCDVEGHELKLLDPQKCPVLETTDVIFEAHDCLIANITPTIIKRFLDTHRISIIYDHPRNRFEYAILSNIAKDVAESVLDEKRPRGMSWVRMQALNHPGIAQTKQATGWIDAA